MYQGSYQNADYSDDDAQFQRLAQSLGANIQKILQNVSKIQRMISQVGTPQDTLELRNQLHHFIHSTGQVAKETTAMLKSLNTLSQSYPASEPRHRRLQRKRLQDDFAGALNSFQTTQRTLQHIDKKSKKAVSVVTATQETTLIDVDESSPSKGNRMTQVMLEEEQRVEELQERERLIHQLESDILDVNTIFKDLASMVHDQGAFVDSIEQNVETSSISILEGAEQLRQAEQYKNKARRKKLFLILLLIIIVAVVIGLIAWLSK